MLSAERARARSIPPTGSRSAASVEASLGHASLGKPLPRTDAGERAVEAVEGADADRSRAAMPFEDAQAVGFSAPIATKRGSTDLPV
jgi:hypothetical protein